MYLDKENQRLVKFVQCEIQVSVVLKRKSVIIEFLLTLADVLTT